MTLLPSSQKRNKLWLKFFLQKLSSSRDLPEKCAETRKGWKHKKTILLQQSHGKERLEDYFTSVAWLNFFNRSRVVFQSFLTMTSLQQDCLLVFSSLPGFRTFSGPFLLVVNFHRNFLPVYIYIYIYVWKIRQFVKIAKSKPVNNNSMLIKLGLMT